MKNENSKGKAFLLLSMIAFFIMSATFLVMPLIQTNIDSGSNAYNIIIGIIKYFIFLFFKYFILISYPISKSSNSFYN